MTKRQICTEHRKIKKILDGTGLISIGFDHQSHTAVDVLGNAYVFKKPHIEHLTKMKAHEKYFKDRLAWLKKQNKKRVNTETGNAYYFAYQDEIEVIEKHLKSLESK